MYIYFIINKQEMAYIAHRSKCYEENSINIKCCLFRMYIEDLSVSVNEMSFLKRIILQLC